MNETTQRSPIVATQGDPEGIGPELLLGLAAERVLQPGDRVVADPVVLDRVAAQIDAAWAQTGRRALQPLLVPINGGDEPGASQVLALQRGVDLVLAQPDVALVTAPIDKHACMRAGFSYPGHTEYLAARAGVEDFAMFMVGPTLRVALATIHIPLATVPARLTRAAIVDVGALVVTALRRDFGIARPKVAVLGLNPHAGEGGVLGTEEQTIIGPAVEALAARVGDAAEIAGPLPADGAMAGHSRGQFDAVVAMFHDQGLAAFKVLHFADGINVTLGLPFVRTSPDHGTAKDIAGQGIADRCSMRVAVEQARLLAAARRGAST